MIKKIFFKTFACFPYIPNLFWLLLLLKDLINATSCPYALGKMMFDFTSCQQWIFFKFFEVLLFLIPLIVAYKTKKNILRFLCLILPTYFYVIYMQFLFAGSWKLVLDDLKNVFNVLLMSNIFLMPVFIYLFYDILTKIWFKRNRYNA